MAALMDLSRPTAVPLPRPTNMRTNSYQSRDYKRRPSVQTRYSNGPVSTGGSERPNQKQPPLNRADETGDLINAVKELIVPFIKDADQAAASRASGQLPDGPRTTLVDRMTPAELIKKLKFDLPEGEGLGRSGLLGTIQSVLDCSVNTWDQGFLDKLTASTNAVGVVSELLLAVLNTNSHVYHVSPALTLIEKVTARAFANKFGFESTHAGGITCPGGSASNMTALTIARGALYPETKAQGNGSYNFTVFTNEHGHYSVQKAAMICGMGMDSVVAVSSDESGRMKPGALREAVLKAKEDGRTPLFVNATAGTTVYGAFDPLREIHSICKEFGLWFHVDGSWGGNMVWSAKHKHKLDGSHLADSLTVNPHKMLNVPMTCSFLLTNDTRVFHKANTLPAGYLFHGLNDQPDEVWDMADLTLQCGRRPDSLKLALAWVHYGASGFERAIDHACDMAAYMSKLLSSQKHFRLVSSNPPPCLQVCFYYSPNGEMCKIPAQNSDTTVAMVKKLLDRGFMVDYAPGDCGLMFRIVVNAQTLSSTVDGLVRALGEVGREVVTAK